MSSINFDNPFLLFLAIPIAALFIIPFAIAIRKDNLNGHNVASGVIHIIMALIIAFVAAGTSIVTTVTETNVYVVADVSYSANRNLETIDRYISDLGGSLPRNSKMGVVTFGKNYQLLTPLGGKTQSVKNSLVDDSATDIISALKYTGELFREDVIKRIVLITDGKQTAETDSNALKRQVDALAERNIHVDAIYLDDNIKDNAREVQISAVEVTPTTFLNGSSYARLTVNCMCPETKPGKDEEDNDVITAYEVETLIKVTRVRANAEGAEPESKSEVVYFTRGSNYYDLPLYTGEAGVFDYEVSVQATNPDEDENILNNVISFTQEVAGKQSILVIYDEPEDDDIIRGAYGDSADITSYYYGSPDILSTIEWINQFDEIVLANVDVTKLRSPNTFLSNLDTAVQMFGKSLVTFGDTNIQNYTHGELKALSDMLPVVFGKSEGNEKLYTLVIDTSRSMEQHGRLDRAKRAAIELIGMLSDSDTVSVVQFNGSPDDVEPKLIKLSDGRKEIIDQINSLEVRQGTNIPAALQFAVSTATSGSYAERRLMLISDGMNFSTDTSASEVRSTVALLRDRGVATSALDVGRAGVEQNAAKRAQQLLENDIAGLGGGAYHDITTDASLKDVLEKELPEDINTSEGAFSPVYIKRRTDKMLQDVDRDELLDTSTTLVNKFIYSRARGAATTVLSVDFVGTSDTLGKTTEVPLYAYWDLGKGKVASFTTGLTGNWFSVSNELRAQILRGVLSTNSPEQKISEPFLVETESFDGYTEVTLTPDTMRLDAVTSIEITSPDGKTTAPVSLANAASKYTHTFITREKGKYTVKITYKERATAKEYTVERAVHVAYPSEYDSFAL
ncbi:MAG: VWA domain-containing protein, partial [Clostridia bacterium]|nr:VWA domain-containing protein [Clostridia bacterium]